MIQPYSIDSTGARFWRRVEDNVGLHVTPDLIRHAKGNKAVAIIWMDPNVFLYLTTKQSNNNWDVEVDDRVVQHLNQYNRYIEDGENIIMPHLAIEVGDKARYGLVTAHEGRHRAAAVRRDAPGERLAVSINLRYDGSSRYYEEGGPPRYEKTFFGISRIPQTLTPQSQDWASRFGMDESEVRRGTVKLGMDEFKDALEPWRMTP